MTKTQLFSSFSSFLTYFCTFIIIRDKRRNPLQVVDLFLERVNKV